MSDGQLIYPHPNPSPWGEGLSDISGSLSLWERTRVRAVVAGVSGKLHIAHGGEKLHLCRLIVAAVGGKLSNFCIDRC